MADWWRRMLQGVAERGAHVSQTGGRSRQAQYTNRTISANGHMRWWDEQCAFRHCTPSIGFELLVQGMLRIMSWFKGKSWIMVFVIVDSTATFCDWNEVLFNSHANSWRDIEQQMLAILWWTWECTSYDVEYKAPHKFTWGGCLSRRSSTPLRPYGWSLNQHYTRVFPDYIQAFVLSSLLWGRRNVLNSMCCMKYMLMENAPQNSYHQTSHVAMHRHGHSISAPTCL